MNINNCLENVSPAIPSAEISQKLEPINALSDSCAHSALLFIQDSIGAALSPRLPLLANYDLPSPATLRSLEVLETSTR